MRWKHGKWVRQFNRCCILGTLLFSLALTTHSVLFRRDLIDFGQYYYGAWVARLGMWEDLYPIPRPQSTHNPGTPPDSVISFRSEALYLRLGIHHPMRVIQSPPAVLFYYPLSYLTLDHAYAFWLYLMGVFGWVVALQSCRIYRHLARGQRSVAEGILVIAITLSPMMYRSVRVANMSPLIAMLLGAGVLGLLAHRPIHAIRAGVALAVGFLLKYITAILIPLYMLKRRVGTLTVAATTVTLIVLATLLFTSTRPFEIFFGRISPTLGRSHEFCANQAIQGSLLRLVKSNHLPTGITVILHCVRYGALFGVLGLIMWRREDLHHPRTLMAAAFALIGWLLLFSPIYWDHYSVYLFPFWGWFLYESKQSRAVSVFSALGIALMYVPLATTGAIILPEPLGSHVTIGTIILWSLALTCLVRNRIETIAPSAPRPTLQYLNTGGLGQRVGVENR